MVGEFTLQDQLGELQQQPVRADQADPPLAGLGDQLSDVEVNFNNYDSSQVGSQVAKATDVTVYMGARPEPAGADSDPAPDSGDEPDA
jgi:hypothetical protein